MKKIFLLLLLAACTLTNASEIVLEITYHGKNVFVTNPMRANGTYCAYAITVNGKEIETSVASASFEIALDEMGFKTGDAINIVITHYDDCKPTILPEH